MGDADHVHNLNAPLVNMHNKKIFCGSNPISTKWADKHLGLIDNNRYRPPLDRMLPQFEDSLKAAIKEAGLAIMNSQLRFEMQLKLKEEQAESN
jgi:dihydrodipicolinate synthase/N-acetylneuraminate lyase